MAQEETATTQQEQQEQQHTPAAAPQPAQTPPQPEPVVVETPQRQEITGLKQMAQEREDRMREREQMLSQERKRRQNRVPGTGVLPASLRTEMSESAPNEESRPKPIRRVKDPRLDRERPLYRDYEREKENTWQGGSVEVMEIFQDRVIQVAIGALVICFIVVAIVLAVTQYNQTDPTAWIPQPHAVQAWLTQRGVG